MHCSEAVLEVEFDVKLFSSKADEINFFFYLLQERSYKDIGFSHLCQRSPKEVAMCVVKLLKPLCNHMENMHNYFQVSGQQFCLKKLSSVVTSKGIFSFVCGEKRAA